MKPIKYIDSLTPMRGIAAMMVMFFHFNEGIRFSSDFQKSLLPTEIEGLLTKSYLWVDFFFLLSGFVIYHVYGQRYFGKKVARDNYKNFIVARLARIYPLHFAILLLLVVFQLLLLLVQPEQAFKNWNTLMALPAELLMLDSIGLFDHLTWNAVSWSISAEWIAYLVFPFLFPFFVSKKQWRYGLLLVLSWVGLTLITLMTKNQNLDATHTWGFLRGGLGFLGGVALYKLYEQGFLRTLFARNGAFLLSLLWVLVFLILDIHDVLIVMGFTPLLLATAYNESHAGQVLNQRPFKVLGDISYSLYMWQGPAMFIYFTVIFGAITPEVYGQDYGTPQYLLGMLIFCGAIFLLSLLTYHRIEVPWRRRVRQWWVSRQAVA